MLGSDIPSKPPIPFANTGGRNVIPTESQLPDAPGKASLADGFPPDTRVPLSAGGIPPSGLDMNGILYLATAWARWQAAGGTVNYDPEFATAVGGYPFGAMVRSTVTPWSFWVCTTDNNLHDPDVNPVGWVNPNIGLSPTYVVFDTAGAFSTVAPAWAKYVDVTVTGGGGGGAGCFGPTSQSGGGGGAGATARGIYNAVAGATYSGFVGAGGAGGNTGTSSAGGPGGDGGTSSFSSLLFVEGGYGGRAEGSAPAGGFGGSVPLGATVLAEGGGDGGDAYPNSTLIAGNGGASLYGGGGRGGRGAGNPGRAAGSGGGGCYGQAGVGGAGAKGKVIVRWLP